MAFAAAIGPIVSGIASLAGAMASASAMNAQADAEEEMAAYNAARQREEAAWAQSKGALESSSKEKEGERRAAQMRATQAQGGAATDTGTTLLLEQSFAAETQWQSDVAMANANKESSTLINKSRITEYEGKIRANASRAQAKASLISGLAGAAKGVAGAFG